MNIYVLDSDLKRVGVIDYYKSIIWTRRFYEPGDFELCVEATPENIDLLRMGRFLYRDVDYDGAIGVIRSVMIIEYIQLVTSYEEGNTLLLQGRDLKSILHKRIVWKQTVLSGTLEDNIRAVITQNLISPSIPERAVEGFTLGPQLGTTETVKTQVTGANIGEWITETLTPYEIGYDVYLLSGRFVFMLCAGDDRSYDQTENPYVIISPTFENLMTSDYVYSMTEACNVALIGGEGEGRSRKTAVAGEATAAGLLRSELFVDAGSASTDSEDGTISTKDYNEQLISQGRDALAEHQPQIAFEGEIDAETNFVYDKDYFLGDKVQIINEYGIEAAVRIIEVIDSEDETGRTVVPTFTGGE